LELITLQEEVRVTRKYQVTIPESVRAELGIKIGDKLIVKFENKRIIMESPKRTPNPSETIWRLFGKPVDVDAARLVEESWETNTHVELKKTRSDKQRKKSLS
jgi:AbrB family looped-hinge helix DNA binding protein